MTNVTARVLRSYLALATLRLALGCSTAADPATTNGASLDGGGSADTASPIPCPPSGTGAVGTAGCLCSTPGERACAGNAQAQPLLCSERAWWPISTCSTGDVCNTIAGPDQGSCTKMDPYCLGLASGQHVCVDAQTMLLCNADLTSHTLARCEGQACVTDACTGVCAPKATQCADGGVQTCGDDGAWASPSPCTGQACVSGSCVGD
jgi:hypothetical protein